MLALYVNEIYSAQEMAGLEFNPEQVQTLLQHGFSQGNFTQALRRHWFEFVPKVYTAKMDADAPREERKAQRILLKPMEEFLCGGNPEDVFKTLKERDEPPQLCGKKFKMGEPTYSCRDCGMDPTCVLCIDCFQKSTHRKHRYKMSTSGGGGYCDCGDKEAWREDPFCSIHEAGQKTAIQEQQEKDPVDNLPPDIRARAHHLFSATIKYVAEMLTWQQVDKLPDDLMPEMDNTYVTMLFNDEVHTYEQVISTLQKAVDCSQKEAIDFATTVDREGRSLVRNGTFIDCNKARDIIEKTTTRLTSNPLKVKVMHSSVVAHQQLALRMLSWLQTIITYSDGLRKMFCLLSIEKPSAQHESIMETMLLADTQLWKVARVQSHQLFMAGVLMDQECKKQFAIIFTQIYPSMLRSFMEDDHDHSVCAMSETVQIYTVPTLLYPAVMTAFVDDDHKRSVSVTSCSVQVYTVPSVARLLVREYNLLQVILDAFMTHCRPKINELETTKLIYGGDSSVRGDGGGRGCEVRADATYTIPEHKACKNCWHSKAAGKFAFDRQERNHQAFRRAQFALYDLKYALTCKPSSDEWCDTLRKNFLNGFKAMLNLLKAMQGMDSVTRQSGQHIEFEPEWEGAFNLQLKLSDNISIMLDWCGTDSSVLAEAYISAVDVLNRLRHNESPVVKSCSVAGHRTDCIDYDVSAKPVSIHLPVTRMLAGLFPQLNTFNVNLKLLQDQRTLSVVELMEPALRCLVMIAQTQAGMWRRNGYSLLNQIYFYHNVRCRSEMYDMDIVLLQAAAGLTNPDHFLIHLINKFGLIHWVRQDYDEPSRTGPEDIVRQIIILAEEFLNLLIVILGERYKVGVGEVSPGAAAKREIVHQLCIQPMAHSELAKMLPEDPYHETGIEDVVNEVATFKKPKDSMSKGLYELKPEYYVQYNPFFWHYSRAEQSKSEEAQRKRCKDSNNSQALPPPDPPAFSANFQPITRLLYCDVLLHVVRNILMRTTARRSRSWSETQCEKMLHIVGLALHEDRRCHERGEEMPFILRAGLATPTIMELLESATENHNVLQNPSLTDLLGWVIKTYKELHQLRDGAGSSSMDTTTSEASTTTSNKLARERKKKADIAAKRRSKIMNQMSRMQRDFIRENAELFEKTSTDIPATGSAMDVTMLSVEPDEYPIVVGPNKSDPGYVPKRTETCILCQEEQEIMHNARAMVLSAFVQKSTVLSKSRGREMQNPDEYDPLFMPADLFIGAYTSTCGHSMHADCWQRYYDNIMAKERRRTLRFRHHISYDIEKFEFLCPLCETLSNTVIPLMPNLTLLRKDDKASKNVDLSLNDWLDGITKTVKSSIQQAKSEETDDEAWMFVPCPLSTITKLMAESVAKNFQVLFDYVYDDASSSFSDSMTDMLKKFATDAYAIGLGVHPDDENNRVPVMAWNTCAYSIMTTEQELRLDDKPLFGSLPQRTQDCISSLVRFAASCSQVIQPDVVKRHCVMLLSALVCDRDDQHLQPTPSLLDLDLFHYLLSVCLALPTLYSAPEDSTDDVPAATSTAPSTSTTAPPTATTSSSSSSPLSSLTAAASITTTISSTISSTITTSLGTTLPNLGNSLPSLGTSLPSLGTMGTTLSSSLGTTLGGTLGGGMGSSSSHKLSRIPRGSLNDMHVLQWVYTAHVVQVMLAADFTNQECMETESDVEGEAMMKWYIKLRKMAGLDVSKPPSPWQLYLYLKEACLPFLRCCALFFHFITDIRPPEELQEIPACLGQYEPLCLYLSLPVTPSSLFDQGEILDNMLTSWCTDTMVRQKLCSANGTLRPDCSIVRYPLSINQLVPLPGDYSELINTVSAFTCPKSVGDDSRAPTMCLVCGQMLCSQSYCCQTELDGHTVGAATAHAHSCGAGTALFLRVRECQVLLLQGRSKGCFYAPPYLDDYGETDQGLRRGNPLHLCAEGYKKLHKLWLSHSIPEKIAHMLEHNTNLLTIEWQHL